MEGYKKTKIPVRIIMRKDRKFRPMARSVFCVGLAFSIVLGSPGFAVLVSAFEAHVVNVTAKIEPGDVEVQECVPGVAWVQTYNPSAGNEKGVYQGEELWALDAHSSGVYTGGVDLSLGFEDPQWRIEKRELQDGALAQEWGVGGVVMSNPSTGDDRVWDIAVASSGIYASGYDSSTPGGNRQWRVEKRSHGDGSLLWSDALQVSLSERNEAARGIAVDDTGFYVVGTDLSSGSAQWRVQKRDHETGTLIWEQVSDADNGMHNPYKITVDSTGLSIVGTGDGKWRIERLSLDTGDPLWNPREIVEDFSTGSDVATSVISDGVSLFVAGYDRVVTAENEVIAGESYGSFQWRIEKRNASDGALIWAQQSNPVQGDESDAAFDVTLYQNSLFVMGTDVNPESAVEPGKVVDTRWRVERRNLGNGALHELFHVQPSSFREEGRGIVSHSTGLYSAGGDFSQGTGYEEENADGQFHVQKWVVCTELVLEEPEEREKPEEVLPPESETLDVLEEILPSNPSEENDQINEEATEEIPIEEPELVANDESDEEPLQTEEEPQNEAQEEEEREEQSTELEELPAGDEEESPEAADEPANIQATEEKVVE